MKPVHHPGDKSAHLTEAWAERAAYCRTMADKDGEGKYYWRYEGHFAEAQIMKQTQQAKIKEFHVYEPSAHDELANLKLWLDRLEFCELQIRENMYLNWNSAVGYWWGRRVKACEQITALVTERMGGGT